MNRCMMLFVAVTLTALTVRGQESTKDRLEKSPRHLEWVKVKHGNREVNCFIAYPEVKDKATAMVVIHEIFGLSDWVRGVADQLAEAGYIAIAPDLLSGMAPGGGGTAELGGGDAVRKAISSLPPDQVTADLNAVVDYVLDHDLQANAAHVGGLLLTGLRELTKDNPAVAEVRGKGLMIAIEFHEPNEFKLKMAWKLLHKVDKVLFAQMVSARLCLNLLSFTGSHAHLSSLLLDRCVGYRRGTR